MDLVKPVGNRRDIPRREVEARQGRLASFVFKPVLTAHIFGGGAHEVVRHQFLSAQRQQARTHQTALATDHVHIIDCEGDVPVVFQHTGIARLQFQQTIIDQNVDGQITVGDLDGHVITDVGAVLLQQITPFVGTFSGIKDPIDLGFPLAVGGGLIQHVARVLDAEERALFHQGQIVVFNEDHIAHAMFGRCNRQFGDARLDRFRNRPNRVLGLDHHIGVGTSDLDTRVVDEATVRNLEPHPRITKRVLGHVVRG